MAITNTFSKASDILSSGGIGVLPTDTIYGLVGSALRKDTVERIYTVRRRTPTKPFIVLIASRADLDRFAVSLDQYTTDFLEKHWPAPLSVLLPVSDEFSYLHRGTGKIAFRMPEDTALRELLIKTGPLVAPSANFEGEKPAETIEEARNYFGEAIDFYVDGEKRHSEPSTLVELANGKVTVLRQGKFRIE